MTAYTLNFAGIEIPLVTLGENSAVAIIKAGEAAASAVSAAASAAAASKALAYTSALGLSPDLVVIGDSITASNSDNTANIHADSWATHLALNSGGKLRMVRNSGIGGQNTAQMLARFAADVIAYLPNGGWCGIMAGTNDTDGTTDTYPNTEAMILLAVQAGIKPFLVSIPPQGSAALPTPAAPTVSAAITGGTLAAATYSYRVAALNSAGTTLCSAAATGVVASGTTGSCTISWAHVQGAATYKIYGRTGGSELLIATVTIAASGCTFIDTGSVTPAGAQPGANTTAQARVGSAHIKNAKTRQSQQRLAQKYGLPFIDFYAALADPVAAGGGMYLTGLTSDGTHPTPKAQRLMGVAAWNALSPYLAPNAIHFPLDNGNPSGLTANALFQTNDASKPNGWVLAAGGTMTTDAAVAGAVFQIQATDASPKSATGPSLGVTAGTRIAFIGKLNATGFDTSFGTFYLRAKFNAGSPQNIGSLSMVGADTNGWGSFYFEATVPAGATSVALEAGVALAPASGATLTLKLAQCELASLTALALSGTQAASAVNHNVKSANTLALITAIRSYGKFSEPLFRLAANDTPTITLGVANAASVIATPASAAMSDARFTYPGGVPQLRGATYPNNVIYVSRGGYYGRDAANTYNVYASGLSVIESTYTGTNFEPIFLGAGNGGVNVRVLVNGIEAGSATVPNTTGSFYRLLLQFPTSATRRITLITGNVPFGGVSYDATGILASVGRIYPVATLVGDSFVEGGAANGNSEAWIMARALGFNAAAAGVGSTGMLNPGGLNTAGGAKVSFAETTRLLDLTLAGVTSAHTGAAVVPNIGFVFGSMNDQGASPGAFGATLQEAITNRSFAMIDAWVAANPGKPLVFFGPTWPSGSPVLDIYRIRDGIQEAAWAAAQNNVWFIDRLAPVPVLRSGVYSVGTDQASLYTGADTTHPTDAGHRLDGLWMAQQVRGLILGEMP